MVVSVTALGEGAVASQRPPIDLCCVVDVSGSMGSLATHEDEDGTVKDDGLSILDVVKHAVKTLMHTLTGQDRVALVAFDNVAETSYTLGEMTEGGRRQAVAALDALRPRGQTNIWEGMLA